MLMASSRLYILHNLNYTVQQRLYITPNSCLLWIDGVYLIALSLMALSFIGRL